jgi:hypothetical protein
MCHAEAVQRPVPIRRARNDWRSPAQKPGRGVNALPRNAQARLSKRSVLTRIPEVGDSGQRTTTWRISASIAQLFLSSPI